MKKWKKSNLFALTLAAMLPFSRVDASNDDALMIDKYKQEDMDLHNSRCINDLGSFVLQGITCYDDYEFISAYDSKNESHSVVYVIKNNILIGNASLYNNAHVGGITVDPNHDIVWITDKGGTISGYNLEDITLLKKDIEPKYKKINVGYDLINYRGNKAVAYITYYNNRLYLGNYSNSDCYLKSYGLNRDGSINLDNVDKCDFINYVQGITFMERDNNTYLFVSSSNGIVNKSKLTIFKYNKNIKDYRTSNYVLCDLPPMLEQISFNQVGELLTVFESNAKKYKSPLNNIDDIYYINVDEIIKKHKKQL